MSADTRLSKPGLRTLRVIDYTATIMDLPVTLENGLAQLLAAKVLLIDFALQKRSMVNPSSYSILSSSRQLLQVYKEYSDVVKGTSVLDMATPSIQAKIRNLYIDVQLLVNAIEIDILDSSEQCDKVSRCVYNMVTSGYILRERITGSMLQNIANSSDTSSNVASETNQLEEGPVVVKEENMFPNEESHGTEETSSSCVLQG